MSTWPVKADDKAQTVPQCMAVADGDLVGANAREDAQPKRGKLSVSGRVISYTATPGTVTIRDDDGKAVASMFYVAYVADHREEDNRPITFAFNGGPGSSSIWLHVGMLGPVRADTPTNQSVPPAPYRIVPSEETIFDKTDIVLIDAIGTGLSRPLGAAKASDFWSVDADINSFAKAIERFLDITHRWNSPKVLIGESYGALRAAGLAYVLQVRGIQTNAVVLISAILNYSVRGTRSDQFFVGYLPTLAATAWYHNRLPVRPADLETFVAEVREFARGPYLQALAKGDDLPLNEKTQIAQQLSRYIGLPTAYLLESNLRVDETRFRHELLRDQHRILGRIDARFSGIAGDATADSPDYDAAETVHGAYIAALKTYLFGTLGYSTQLNYRPDYYDGIGDKWDYRHKEFGAADASLGAVNFDLSAAMRENPHLIVLDLQGYYDMATPFFAAEYDLKHMELDPTLRQNLSFAHYESGHMIYLQTESRKLIKRDLDEFYDRVHRDK